MKTGFTGWVSLTDRRTGLKGLEVFICVRINKKVFEKIDFTTYGLHRDQPPVYEKIISYILINVIINDMEIL